MSTLEVGERDLGLIPLWPAIMPFKITQVTNSYPPVIYDNQSPHNKTWRVGICL